MPSKKRTFGLLVLSAVLLFPWMGSALPSQEANQYDYLFLIDCSGSMIGLPKGSGATVIFPEVAKDIKNFIDSIKDGANISVVQFHRGLQREYSKSNVGSLERAEIVGYVNSLQESIQKSPGQVTWIYLSLSDVLDKLKSINAQSAQNGIKRIQSILLYTDGRDNGPQEVNGQRVNMDWIIQKFRLQRSDQENLYLKYITLGMDLPASEENVLTSTPGVEFIKQRGPVFGTKSYNVEIRPTELDFGNFKQAESAQCELEMTFSGELAEKYLDRKIMMSYELPSDLPSSVSLGFSPQEFSFSKSASTLNLRILKTAAEVMGVYEGGLQFKVDSFRDEIEHKDIVIYFTPERIRYKFAITPPLIIEVKSKDGGRLDKDLGVIKRKAEIPSEITREYSFVYNAAAEKVGAPIFLYFSLSSGNKQVAVGPADLMFQVNSAKSPAPLTLTRSSSVKIRYRDPGVLKSGKYQGKILIKAANARIEGEGVKQEISGPCQYSIPFDFRVPWALPTWGLEAIALLAVAIALLLTLSVYCRKRKVFPEGGHLSMTGVDYYIQNIGCLRSIFKKSLSAGGSNSDMDISGLQPDIQFYLKPIDDDSIAAISAGKSVLKNAVGDVIIESEGTTILNGDSFEIEIAPDAFEKIYFKKLA